MQWSHSARLGLWEDSRPLMNVESVRPLAGMQACEQPRVGTEAAADSLLLVPAGQEGLGMAEEGTLIGQSGYSHHSVLRMQKWLL